MSDCIKTNCALNHAGYGVAYYKPERKTMLHHRLAYIQHHGLLPADIKGKVIRHTCDNPACVNPEHLIIGSQADNVQDMWERKRANPGKAIGTLSGSSKLTEADVIAIRASTATQKQLAEQYGVDFTCISRIQARKTWKHI